MGMCQCKLVAATAATYYNLKCMSAGSIGMRGAGAWLWGPADLV